MKCLRGETARWPKKFRKVFVQETADVKGNELRRRRVRHFPGGALPTGEAPPPAGMPSKKGGKKKAGKKKGNTYFTNEDGVEHCAPFGFAPGDLIDTPLGLRAVVLGVKYAFPEDLTGGVLWVRYALSEKEAPIENPSVLTGYKRASATEHLWREVDKLNAAAAGKQRARDADDARKRSEEAVELAKMEKSLPQTAKKPAVKKPAEEVAAPSTTEGKQNANSKARA